MLKRLLVLLAVCMILMSFIACEDEVPEETEETFDFCTEWTGYNDIRQGNEFKLTINQDKSYKLEGSFSFYNQTTHESFLVFFPLSQGTVEYTNDVISKFKQTKTSKYASFEKEEDANSYTFEIIDSVAEIPVTFDPTTEMINCDFADAIDESLDFEWCFAKDFYVPATIDKSKLVAIWEMNDAEAIMPRYVSIKGLAITQDTQDTEHPNSFYIYPTANLAYPVYDAYHFSLDGTELQCRGIEDNSFFESFIITFVDDSTLKFIYTDKDESKTRLATFKKIPSVTVSFDTDGKATKPEPITLDIDHLRLTEEQLAAPQNPTATFVSWKYTDDDGSQNEVEADLTPCFLKDVTLTATWSE